MVVRRSTTYQLLKSTLTRPVVPISRLPGDITPSPFVYLVRGISPTPLPTILTTILHLLLTTVRVVLVLTSAERMWLHVYGLLFCRTRFGIATCILSLAIRRTRLVTLQDIDGHPPVSLVSPLPHPPPGSLVLLPETVFLVIVRTAKCPFVPPCPRTVLIIPPTLHGTLGTRTILVLFVILVPSARSLIPRFTTLITNICLRDVVAART